MSEIFLQNSPNLWQNLLPSPERNAHKYNRGSVLVLGGGIEGVGAARLSAKAALYSGAGLVTLGVPSESLAAHASREPNALMQRKCDGMDGLLSLLDKFKFSSIVIGPAYGVGLPTRKVVFQLLHLSHPLILDADALTSFAGEAQMLGEAIMCSQIDCVLTPHEGEFSRLFSPQHDILHTETKSQRAQRAACFTGAIIVLKGADTIIAAPDGRVVINNNGTPWLATAGSGDVLAGVIAGLMAQKMPAFEAVCAAVFLHGAAGLSLGERLIADELPEEIREEIKGLT
jgi:ADP-dependent NAD(P)H-hydrate dehydratase / NAD(P)H-hydrate epimerase